ncbi:hypothetical protein B0H19DRAFT_1323216 [Mycena capillaripes]|nr:hypothetical protein B0H19DRAFT_1323216 [Mycena capillaripes]
MTEDSLEKPKKNGRATAYQESVTVAPKLRRYCSRRSIESSAPPAVVQHPVAAKCSCVDPHAHTRRQDPLAINAPNEDYVKAGWATIMTVILTAVAVCELTPPKTSGGVSRGGRGASLGVTWRHWRHFHRAPRRRANKFPHSEVIAGLSLADRTTTGNPDASASDCAIFTTTGPLFQLKIAKAGSAGESIQAKGPALGSEKSLTFQELILNEHNWGPNCGQNFRNFMPDKGENQSNWSGNYTSNECIVRATLSDLLQRSSGAHMVSAWEFG